MASITLAVSSASGWAQVEAPVVSGAAASTQDVQAQVEQARRSGLQTAARAEAVDRLAASLEREPLTRDMTVGQWLDAIDGVIQNDPRVDLRQALSRGEFIDLGSSRDAGSAQVRLRVQGQSIVNTLLLLSTLAGEARPIPQAQLHLRIAHWQRRSFSATGVSFAPERLERAVEETPAGFWFGGKRNGQAQRRLAMEQAKADAVEQALSRALTRSGPIVLLAPAPADADPAATLTLAGALGSDAAAILRQWLTNQPITRVRFLDDGRIEVKLTTASPGSLFDDLRSAIDATRQPGTMSDEAWQQIVDELTRALPREMVGRSRAEEAAAAPTAGDGQTNVAVATPPAWAGQVLRAQGTFVIDAATATGAEAARQKLLALAAAKRDAIANLQRQIGLLEVSEGNELQATFASLDAFDEWSLQVLDSSKYAAPSFGDSGSVSIEVTLPGSSIWAAVQSR